MSQWCNVCEFYTNDKVTFILLNQPISRTEPVFRNGHDKHLCKYPTFLSLFRLCPNNLYHLVILIDMGHNIDIPSLVFTSFYVGGRGAFL